MINKSVAILITCYNRKEKTLKCLRSIKEICMPQNVAVSVFLVDDGSTDGTGDAVMNEHADVTIIKGNGALYWNRGMIKAWKAARQANDFDFYLWLNDDTSLTQSAINELLEISATKNDEALICGICKSPATGNITYSGYKHKNMLKPNGEPQLCDTLNGNLVLVPKKVFVKVGYLDEAFAHSIGDFDYGYRATKLGVKIFTSKNAVGICEANAKLPLWCYGNINIVKRFKNLYSPLGYATPLEYFIFQKRHYGFVTAVKGITLIHCRVLFPSLWNYKKIKADKI